MTKLTGLKKQFESSIMFESSEFELLKFDCICQQGFQYSSSVQVHLYFTIYRAVLFIKIWTIFM